MMPAARAWVPRGEKRGQFIHYSLVRDNLHWKVPGGNELPAE
jgi:hypothetical protein